MIRKRWQKVREIFNAREDPLTDNTVTFSNNPRSIAQSLPEEANSNFPTENETEILSQKSSSLEIAPLTDDGNSPDFLIGQDIDSYKLIKKIGSGGMGDVYLAHDAELKRQIAVKLLPEKFTKEKERLHRFRQEAQAISQLNHPNILTIHKIGQTNQIHYIVTEFVDGCTLRECIISRMKLGNVLDIIIQVASALKAAHEAGIVHRDIKPENVMLRRDGYVKVLDFGLAKLLEHNNSDSTAVTTFQTQPGILIGTPNYISPEQIEGEEVDARTDLFSLGSLLYECLTGRATFQGANITETVAQIIHHNPLPPSKFNSQIPPELDSVTLKLLKKKPGARYQTANELIIDLRKITSKLQSSERLLTQPLQAKEKTSPIKILNTLTEFAHPSPKIFLFAFALITFVLLAYFLYPANSPRLPKTEVVRLFNTGTEAMREGTYYKASKLFEDAVKIDGSFALAHARLAEAWMELDYTGRSQNEMLKVRNVQQEKQPGFSFALSQKDDESLYIDAINATVLRDFSKAAGIYETLAKRYPNEAFVYLDLGRAYEKNEETDKAIEYYEKAAGLNPQYGAAFMRLGVLQSRKAEFEKSNAAFNTAENIYDRLSNDEGVAEVKFQRGVSLNSQEKLDNARAQFEQVLKIQRANKYQQIKSILQISGVCYSEGKTVCAEDYALRAIKSAKDERMENLITSGLIDLGNVFMTRQTPADYEKADEQFQQAVELARRDGILRNEARALLSLGSLRIQQKKPDEAINFINQALPFYQSGGYKKEVSQANLLLGRASEMKEDYEGALHAYEQVESSEDISNQAYAKMVSGEIFMRQEKFPEAFGRFQQSYDLYQSLSNRYYTAYILLNLSEVLCQLGRFEDAKDRLLKAEAIVKEDSSFTQLMGNRIRLLNAQIAFGEQNYVKAVKDAEQVIGATNPSDAFEANKIIGLAKAFSNPKDGEGVQKCLKAVEYATVTKDVQTINRAKLALAEAYLNTGNNSDALQNAIQAKDYFAAAGQQESAWRALLMAARASRQKGDLDNAKAFASKALETLSLIQAEWGEAHFKIYLAKPAVKIYYKQAEELAQS